MLRQVDDVFRVLSGPAHPHGGGGNGGGGGGGGGRLTGEFVRAEGQGLGPAARRRQLRRGDVVAAAHGSCVLRIMTNRKPAGWQAARGVDRPG